MTVGSAGESKEVTDGIGEGKMVLNGEISQRFSLVVVIFAFFLFSRSAGDCDGAT